MWVIIGFFLGTLYSVSIQAEINLAAKQGTQPMQRNPLFSIGRSLLTSGILVYGFSRKMEYGFAGLGAFLLAKYLSLFLILKRNQKGE
jgi:hypothetical protein